VRESPAAAGERATDGEDRRRRWLLIALSGNMLLDAIEVSVVLVALPTIGAALGLSTFGVQWLMTGFAAGFAAFLLAGPALIARWGRRRVYLAAMLCFAVVSGVSGLVVNSAVLVACRVVKGACAALTAPTGLAIITVVFPEGEPRRRAVAVYSMFGAAGFTGGLLLSGVLTGLDWRWTVVFPAPVALVLLVIGFRTIPRATGPAPVPGAARTPLWRNRSFVVTSLAAAAQNGGYIGFLYLVVVTLRPAPLETALLLLPAGVPLLVAIPFVEHVVRRTGTAPLVAAGALSSLAGILLATRASGPLPSLLLVGAGLALSFTALNTQVTAAVEPAVRARAVPVYQASVQAGTVAVLPLTAAALGQAGSPRPALWLLAAVAAAGLAVATAARPWRTTARPG
jgi:predicted MFS family arabinose efflux permease